MEISTAFYTETLSIATQVGACRNEVIFERYHNPLQHLISGILLAYKK